MKTVRGFYSRHLSSQRGFTLVELLLATAIFSFVLTGMALGVVRLIHFYQATVDIRTTQEAAREVSDDITEAARNSTLIVARSSGAGRHTSVTYGSQPESQICFFTNVAYQPDGTIIGDGITFYTQQSGTNQWTVYQGLFVKQQSTLTGSGSCNPTSVNSVSAVTNSRVSFIRFSAVPSSDNRLLQMDMVVAGSDDLDPTLNINYGTSPAPTCIDGDYNNYCSITPIQVSAAAREGQT